MSCRCSAEFCYLCAAPWKTCECVQWEKGRLVADAQYRMENELGAQVVTGMPPEARQRQVEQRVEVLRHNHHCERHVWRHRQGRGQCEECHDVLPEFLKVCLRNKISGHTEILTPSLPDLQVLFNCGLCSLHSEQVVGLLGILLKITFFSRIRSLMYSALRAAIY